MTLEWKFRWVKDGHRNPEPEWSAFAGVFSRESTRIALTHAALNDVPICACDAQNTYLQAPSSENTMFLWSVVWIIEFGKACNHTSFSLLW